MRKTLVTMAALGALALPIGVVAAQDDTPDTGDTTTITCEEQVRDRDCDHDRTGDQVGDQLQQRDRVHEHDGTCDHDGDQLRQREQNRAGDPSGDQLQQRQRTREGDGEQGAGQQVMERNELRQGR